MGYNQGRLAFEAGSDRGNTVATLLDTYMSYIIMPQHTKIYVSIQNLINVARKLTIPLIKYFSYVHDNKTSEFPMNLDYR